MLKAIAKAQFVRMSARKMRLVGDLIRGQNVEEALNSLHLLHKAAAVPLEKTLRSAVANAMNIHGDAIKDPEALQIREVLINEGPTLKRFRPRAMGRTTRIRKRTCHIKITVSDESAGE